MLHWGDLFSTILHSEIRWNSTDVSEENITNIFCVNEWKWKSGISSLIGSPSFSGRSSGSRLVALQVQSRVTGIQYFPHTVYHMGSSWFSYLVYFWTQRMEAVCSSETYVDFHRIAKLYIYRCETVKSNKLCTVNSAPNTILIDYPSPRPEPSGDEHRSCGVYTTSMMVSSDQAMKQVVKISLQIYSIFL
jgi:hypothetical protein